MLHQKMKSSMFNLEGSSYGCKLATYLDPLVGVAHHGDEEVDEDDDGDEEVDEEDDLEEHDRPLAHVRAQLQVLGAGQAEEAKDQQVEGLRDGHREAACNQNVSLSLATYREIRPVI